MRVDMIIDYQDGSRETCRLLCRLDTVLEVAYFVSSGIMPYVVNKVAGARD